jgi:hypothetical protein
MVRSVIKASIYLGDVLEGQSYDGAACPIAISTMLVTESADPAFVTFNWDNGPVLLGPAKYSVRLEHLGDNYFNFQLTDNCGGKCEPLPLTGFSCQKEFLGGLIGRKRTNNSGGAHGCQGICA